ncbi:MAG: hypothetical protein MSIBF_03150 [Candidatus Altiarchaeales archaeon IMC4]|nr:MAG: hypothetical protein MSIBF_03150 [Candidatus Altiarchaeales archaeon IMC4]
MNHYKLAKGMAEDIKGRFGSEISSIVLFGSAAKGGENDESDIDLLVVSKQHLSKGLNDSIGKVLSKGVVPEVLNLTDVEFTRMKTLGSPLYFSIRDEGIKLC